MDSHFAMPSDLSPAGQEAWKAIVTVLMATDPQMGTGGCTAFRSPKEWAERGEKYGLESVLVVVYDGGCTAFRSPKEWAERGEKYGLESVLVVVYDGGSHRQFFESDGLGCEDIEHMNAALEAVGFYVEACTGWYGAVYPL